MTKQFKYEKIKEAILKDVEKSGILRIPSEREISQTYQVSRRTARRALDLLEAENLITRTVGKGTFIKPEARQAKIYIIIPSKRADIHNYVENEIAGFIKNSPKTEIEIVCLTGMEMIQFIKETSGAKLILSTNFGYLSKTGLLSPLNRFKEFDKTINKIQDQYVEWNNNLYTGECCYSIPFCLNVATIAYNRGYAEKLGLDTESGISSFDDLLEWNKKAVGSDIYSTALSEPAARGYSQLPSSIYSMISGGDQFLKMDGDTIDFDFKYGKEWFESHKRIIDEGNIYLCGKNEASPLLQGKTLFNLNAGSWIVAQKKARPDLDIVVQELPPFNKGGQCKPTISLTGIALIEDERVNENDKRRAWEFIRFITSDKGAQKRMTEQLSYLPVNKEVYASLKDNDEWKPFVKSLENGILRCDHPLQHGIIKVVRKYFFKVVSGEISAVDAVERVNEIVDVLLEVEQESSVL